MCVSFLNPPFLFWIEIPAKTFVDDVSFHTYLDNPESESTKETWKAHSTSWEKCDSLAGVWKRYRATLNGLQNDLHIDVLTWKWKTIKKKKLSLNGDLCLAVRCMLLSNLNETSLFTGCMCFTFTRMLFIWAVVTFSSACTGRIYLLKCPTMSCHDDPPGLDTTNHKTIITHS